MKSLYVAWQNNNHRNWTPVGKLSHEKGFYRFVYTRGAESAPDFKPFGHMQDLHQAYNSQELFPIFANRILAKSRPEYSTYLKWLGLSSAKYDELEELARTGGLRATDSLELFPSPEPTENKRYEVYFFCRGMRHLHPENQERARNLKVGERLFLMQDLQNEVDDNALLVRTCDPITLVGYAPRYYSAEFTSLINLGACDQVKITVEQINSDAPMQYRVLCKISSPWPKGFTPFAREEFKPLA